MTNEEKMLDILAGMSLRLDGMGERLDGVNERLNGMNERLNGMSERLDSMDVRLDSLATTTLKTNIRIETDIIPRLDALAEGFDGILETHVPREEFDELAGRVQLLEMAQ